MKAQMTPLEELRHSASHVLATAVLRLFPEAKLDIGPPTDNGFYYDLDLDQKLSAEDLEKIEAEMKSVIKENQRFERQEVTRDEAVEIIKGCGQERYKLGRLADIPEGDAISFYRNGEFIDLCAGSHVNYTKKIKAFKLLSIAGAYHRGNEKNKQLQRIYGTAFPNKEELEQYLDALEQAKARDHRKIGRDLKLFVIDEDVGQGLILWTPKGSIIRQELQTFIGDELRKQGYDQVFTPHIGKLALYKTSGHFPYYKESQFPAIAEPDALERIAHEGCSCAELTARLEAVSPHFAEEINRRTGRETIGIERTMDPTKLLDGFMLKPMNCPHHIKIFASQQHSYRDLPLRLAEFGTVYRWEQSGELNGMTRVRGFTQDDAHIFCTEDQVSDEVMGCLSLVKTVLTTLGMHDYRVRVGLRDPDSSKFTGDAEKWDKAEDACRRAASTLGVPFTEEPGEAAFYGPKIDFVVKDVIGREWQLGTVQIDYVLPVRFDLSYIGADNQPHHPVMIHRAPFGSMERFCGVLIEHFAGNFPLWLSPEQVRVLPISDKTADYANDLLAKLKDAGIRASIDRHDEKFGAKIRRAEMDHVPVMLVCGEKEAEAGNVSIRSRIGKGIEGTVSVDEAIATLKSKIAAKALAEGNSL
ncbi:threonine--tRNA ligase [Cerasicoccus arenae]|uniref:Threonine--tRNA ligase n=1 Tax=Cerasicoccus arenae TaxID=424488 RepID=A0A8J3GEQ6_9BACT|nr:threonine--tRNA ligase [Cerasicoccus arenae]MBK1856829.1 threonine--tRNA ligase [Cerasicoccus arenae]GHC11128.1 threonine--tRNA ligase [Cerasicoccus arenae]